MRHRVRWQRIITAQPPQAGVEILGQTIHLLFFLDHIYNKKKEKKNARKET